MSLYSDENKAVVPVIDLYNIHEIEALRTQIAEQAAQIEMLTTAAINVVGPFIHAEQGSPIQILRKALATPPSQALADFAAKVREQCAVMLENGYFLHDQAPTKLLAMEAAKAIRNLKELP